MNKIITSIAALALCCSAAQAAVTVTADGNAVESGSTITVGKEAFEMLVGAPLFRWEGGVDIEVDGKFPINVSLTSDGEDIQFCPLGQQCYVLRPSNGMFTGSGSLTDQSKSIPVHVNFMGKEELPKFSQYIDIELMDKSFSSFKFRIQFDTELSGVENVAVDNVSVSFSGNSLSYSVGSAAELNVWSVTGNRVVSEIVNGNGSCDLSSLPNGIYVYRLAGHTGKILVK